MSEGDRTTVTQAARRLALHKSTVSRLVRQLGLAKDEWGRFDFAAFAAARDELVNDAKSGNHAGRLLGDEADETEPSPAPTPANGVRPGEEMSYRRAKTERENWAARTARLDYEKRVGLLVSAAYVDEAMVDAGRRIRQALDSLPDAADAVLAAALAGGANGVRGALRDLARRVETTLSEALEALKRDAEAAGDDDAVANEPPASMSEETEHEHDAA